MSKRRFSKAELKLARKIQEREGGFLLVNLEEGEQETFQQAFEKIISAPLIPSYGIEPPWWEQAIAEADQDLVWVNGGGYMHRQLWEDALKCDELTRREKP